MKPIIDHINRYVINVENSIKFYKDVLNYELIDRGTKANGKLYAILSGYDHELFISEKDNFIVVKEDNFRHLGYQVDNIEILLKDLIQMGYINKNEKPIIKKFSKQIYIKDPDGLEIDLIQWTDKEGFYKSLLNNWNNKL